MGRPCVPASGWRAGWHAGGSAACRGHCESWQATVRDRAAWRSSGAPRAALGPGRRGPLVGEGGLALAWQAGTRLTSPSRSPALCGLGGGKGGAGCAGVVQPLCSRTSHWSMSRLRRPPGGCKRWLHGLGLGPNHGYLGTVGCCPGCAATANQCAPGATARGGGSLSLVPCDARVARGGVRQGGPVRPSLRRARPLAAGGPPNGGCLVSSGAGRGPGG